ncbi:MAG: hypothetical protein JXR96_10490 [Deltaproteobacteria bacterium]|nr:hypothetical protein [Deltaproteobacteria bacterium]
MRRSPFSYCAILLSLLALACSSGGGDTECAADEVAVDGSCYKRDCADWECPDGFVCADGACTGTDCVGVDCGAGELCAAGECYPIDCESRTCPGLGEVCVDEVCTQTSCVGATCPAGETCAAGECYPEDCTTQTCEGFGEVCINEECADAACIGVTCPSGERCALGNCYPFTDCDGLTCDPGYVCIESVCTEALCADVICSGDTYCEQGWCIEQAACRVEVAELLPDRIDTDTTLPEDSCYLVEHVSRVAGGATLTIEPGATLIFRQDAGLEIDSDSALVASGSPEKRILMTGAFEGEFPSRGFWTGVVFDNANSFDNLLEHVVIEYGGSEPFLDAAGNVVLKWASRATIRDCILRDSAEYGLRVDDRGELTFEHNEMLSNTLGAVYAPASMVGALDEASSYSGNDLDIVFVEADSIGADADWPAINAIYFIDGIVHLDAVLTLPAGARLEFTQDSGLDVDSDGGLIAIGEQDNHVLLTGTEPEPGWWRGLIFDDSNSFDNRIEHVTVEYGGSYQFLDAGGNVIMAWGSRLAMNHCLLRHSAEYGLRIYSGEMLDEFNENELVDNALGAVFLPSSAIGRLDGASTYAGNGIDRLYVNGDSVGDEQFWPATDAPYVVFGLIDLDARVTVEPGATFLFDQDAGLDVDSDGALTAVGTEEAPILFSGTDSFNGWWRGLVFDDTSSFYNELAYAIVEYGGAYEFMDNQANVMLKWTSFLNVSHCTIRHSGGWGLWYDDNATLDESDNIFEDCPDGDVGMQQ